ncbi:xylulokinase [Arsenicitalea aurantiaca]|uniref:Xylulose kinase n=2 Tax=Arsenicitalea aurantiaca TaxID=1783274 RepID=A0A433XGK8_9HYPH|nr:xylulokinase [Arsenicitalea aurantiaca]
MARTALLGVDIGTSSCKALLLDAEGTVLASETVAYPVSTPRPFWSEQDPQSWIEGARKAIAGLRAKAPGIEILAIGLSGQMHGLTPLDDALEVIRPAILWNDQRNAAECAEITAAIGGEAAMLAATNNRMLIGYTGGKIAWMRAHEPENFARLRHCLNPKDYLRYRMTGTLATEVSDASGTGMFDVAARKWSDAVIEAVGIDRAALPDCAESHIVTGHVGAEAAALFGLAEGIPVVGGGGDAVVQTLGSGVIDPGDLQTTIGTAGILASSLDRAAPNPEGRLQVFCNVAPDRWHCMGVSLNAGGALSWFRTLAANLGHAEGGAAELDFAALVEKAARSPAGARGLLFLPYLNGERCPHPDPEARGGFVGLTWRHRDADLVRALLEGVVLSLRDIHALMEQMGIARNRIRASGGGARSALWRQIQADMFGCEVATTEGASEGGAYGAALVAGIGIGVWPDAASAAAVCRPATRDLPDPSLLPVYDKLFGLYQGLYPALETTFAGLSDPIFDQPEA